MEKAPVFEGEAQKEKKNHVHQPIGEWSEEQWREHKIKLQKWIDARIDALFEVPKTAPPADVREERDQPNGDKTVFEVLTEAAGEKEVETEANGVTEDADYASVPADPTTKTAEQEEEEEKSTSETKPVGKEPERLRKLFVAGLPHGAKIEDIEKALGEFYVRFGEVESVFVANQKQSGVSKGCGFVTFATKAAVDAVISSRPHSISGHQVCEKRAAPMGDNIVDTKTLFVTGITEGVDEKALSDYFSKYGTVDSVKIHTDAVTQKPRGFAFVNFANSDSVDQCVVDSKFHVVNSISISAEKSIPKNAQNQRDRMFRAQRSLSAMDLGRPEWGGWGMEMPPIYYTPPFGGMYPPRLPGNQHPAYRSFPAMDPSARNYPPPLPVRAFLNDMPANAAMGRPFRPNQGPPMQQRRSGGRWGGPMGQRRGRWSESHF